MLNKKIIDIVHKDDKLKSIYKIVTFVIGNGFVTALYLQLLKNCFTILNNTL